MSVDVRGRDLSFDLVAHVIDPRRIIASLRDNPILLSVKNVQFAVMLKRYAFCFVQNNGTSGRRVDTQIGIRRNAPVKRVLVDQTRYKVCDNRRVLGCDLTVAVDIEVPYLPIFQAVIVPGNIPRDDRCESCGRIVILCPKIRYIRVYMPYNRRTQHAVEPVLSVNEKHAVSL